AGNRFLVCAVSGFRSLSSSGYSATGRPSSDSRMTYGPRSPTGNPEKTTFSRCVFASGLNANEARLVTKVFPLGDSMSIVCVNSFVPSDGSCNHMENIAHRIGTIGSSLSGESAMACSRTLSSPSKVRLERIAISVGLFSSCEMITFSQGAKTRSLGMPRRPKRKYGRRGQDYEQSVQHWYQRF